MSWSVWTAHGDEICAGLSEDDAPRVAQAWADRKREAVYVGEDSDPDDARAVLPS